MAALFLMAHPCALGTLQHHPPNPGPRVFLPPVASQSHLMMLCPPVQRCGAAACGCWGWPLGCALGAGMGLGR
eukprot:1140006-Pelagomonas_calceolata.AAC.2